MCLGFLQIISMITWWGGGGEIKTISELNNDHLRFTAIKDNHVRPYPLWGMYSLVVAPSGVIITVIDLQLEAYYF